jgi:hypothetical protein
MSPRVRGQKVANLLVRALLATPLLHRALSHKVLTIEVIGRKTGRRYRLPAGYVRTPGGAPDGLLVGAGGRWWRNLAGGSVVTVRLRRRRTAMSAEVVTDRHRCADYYALLLTRQPLHARMIGLEPGTDGLVDLAQVDAVRARGAAIVCLTPLRAA